MSSGYHNLKVNEKASYLTTFTCQLGRYRYKRLPFGAVPAEKMFQRKINEIFKDLPNVFGIADDILVVGYNVGGKDHADKLWRVLKICRQVNINLNKGKCHLRCTSVPFWESHGQEWCETRPRKAESTYGDATSKNKKELQGFLGIISYLSKFSPSTADNCESLRQLTSSKT